jgi:hypothetical protein
MNNIKKRKISDTFDKSEPYLLKFPESHISDLIRTDKGIESKTGSWLALLNYPAVIKATKKGIDMIDYSYQQRGKRSTVHVSAYNEKDQKYPLFCFNCSFFGTLQGKRDIPDEELTEEYGKKWTTMERDYFVYDKRDDTIGNEPYKITGKFPLCNISFHDKSVEKKLPMIRFGATYALGTFWTDEEIEFDIVNVPHCPDNEQLVLYIDGDVEKKQFLLKMKVPV